MILLNAVLAFGAFAFNIPIIIHLFNRSRFKVVKWGAMHLLAEILRRNRRRIQIEQLILLLVRAAIPVVLALCMAGPVLTGCQELAADKPTSLVLLLDNSYSMEARGSGKSNYQVAREGAVQMVESLPRGSDAGVVMMGGQATPLFEGKPRLARVAGLIAKTEPGYGAADIMGSLQAGLKLAQTATLQRRDIVVLSDFQKTDWRDDQGSARQRLVGDLGAMPVKPALVLLRAGKPMNDNVAVDSLDIAPQVVGVKQKVTVTANIKNYGPQRYGDMPVSFKVDDQERTPCTVQLEPRGDPRGEAQARFECSFDTGGSHYVEVAIEPGTLKADKSYLAAIPVWEKIPVLLVNGRISKEPLRWATGFLEVALAPYAASKTPLADLIQTRTISPGELTPTLLSESRVVVLADVPRLQDDQVKALVQFVSDGGGLIIYPGDNVDMDREWYNQRLGDTEGLLPARLVSRQGSVRDEKKHASIPAQHYDHPALAWFNDPHNASAGDGRVWVWLKLDDKRIAPVPAPEGPGAPGFGGDAGGSSPATTMARLDNGDALLVEKKFGHGVVVQGATSCDVEWGDLPTHATFYLPLMQRLVIYAASSFFPPRNVEVGQPLVAFYSTAMGGKTGVLTDPEGQRHELTIENKGPRAVAQYGDTSRPGRYVLEAADAAPDQRVIHFVVNTSRQESDIRCLSDEELGKLGKDMGATVAQSYAEYRDLDHTRRFGREVWPWLFGLAIVLLFAEIYLQQRFARGAPMTTDLVFRGLLGPWQGLALAALLAAAGVWLYRRETRQTAGLVGWVLPIIRAVVIVLFVLMLTGPILHYRQSIGRRMRVLIFVDASQSMTLDDPQMETGRKLLVLRSLGQLPKRGLDDELVAAMDALTHARQLGAAALSAPPSEADSARTVSDIAAEIKQALDHLRKVRPEHLAARPVPGGLDAMPATAPAAPVATPAQTIERLRTDLLVQGTDRLAVLARDPRKAAELQRKLGEFQGVIAAWERELSGDFDAYAEGLVASSPGVLGKAVSALDGTSRYRRVETALLEGENPLLAQLAEQHDVELWALQGSQAQRLWASGPGNPAARGSRALPTKLAVDPTATMTDLAGPIKSQLALGARDDRRQVVLVFSDGQHNAPSEPKQMAAELRGNAPLYTIGVGSALLPKDLAISEVNSPRAVSYKDRIRGEVVLKDDMPPGLPFTLRIESQGQSLWTRQLDTDRSHRRTFDFDFAVESLVTGAAATQPGQLGRGNIPLTFKVSVVGLEAQNTKGTKVTEFVTNVIKPNRQALLLDGRPRWEFRYIRNAYERDGQWKTNSLVYGVTDLPVNWPRGDTPGTFPKDKATLFENDLIIFGEVPRALLKKEELEWIRDFVVNRGGGLVFIDGMRGVLRLYADSPLGDLLPVKWSQGAAGLDRPTKLRVTEAGERFGPLMLIPDAPKNRALWEKFEPPHWVALVQALPSAQVLVEAVSVDKAVPALVSQNCGAGKVLYCAYDDSWRMRFDAADEYHPKYWKLIGDWVMQEEFSGQDRYVSIGTDGPIHNPGDKVSIRVRLRDKLGKPWENAQAEAILARDGQKVATIKLEPYADDPGHYAGVTAALVPGSYEVTVHAEGVPENQMQAKAQFVIKAPDSAELANLAANEELLAAMADNSGGEYLREEKAGELVTRLARPSLITVRESDIALWNNWHWFIPIVVLLTIEWLLRKRAGMM